MKNLKIQVFWSLNLSFKCMPSIVEANKSRYLTTLYEMIFYKCTTHLLLLEKIMF